MTANGHHHSARTAIAAVTPRKDAIMAVRPDRAQDRVLTTFSRSSARLPARAPASVSVPPPRYKTATRTNPVTITRIANHQVLLPRTRAWRCHTAVVLAVVGE